MAITITQREGDPILIGGTQRFAQVSIALDTSYPAGGESLTPSALGFSQFDLVYAEPSMGYTFEYDHTNNKLKAFTNAPPIVYEEKHTTTTHYITLDYPAAWIINVSKAATAMVWAKTALTTATLGANEWCLRTAIVDGERTQITLDNKTATVYVTYVTQAWAELYDLLVQDETATVTAAGTTPDNTLMAFGYCSKATGYVFTPITDEDTAATAEVKIDLGTRTASLGFNAAQTGATVYLTYLKMPTSGWIYNRHIADEDGTTSGECVTFDLPCLLWCISGYALTSASSTRGMVTMDAAAVTATIKPSWGMYRGGLMTSGAMALQGFMFGQKVSGTLIHSGSYIWGHDWEVPVVPLEVKNGADLSNVTGLKVGIWGR